ncbi:MAG: UDP-N-acetylmuramoyl-L-alanine--D-glutamate ligase [Alphaproteobacteria bacterium]|nr:UDP-N-acetylmuramoyl-L-alanine--D-glutamate ligase [Alphaproteobacteria bacterium]
MIDLAPLKETFKDKPLAILGLGKSGLPVFEACAKAGIETLLWDDNEQAREAARKAGGTVRDFTNDDFSAYAALCLSPGIPLTHPKPHPAVLRAQEAGAPVLGDIELFHMAKPHAHTIGITGTNGKSTTTALIGHILHEAGVESAVGGNIGAAILTLPDLGPEGIYVLEMSSYQIDLCPTFEPEISLLINISPDHLGRHGGMEGYVAVKQKIFRGPGTAIVSLDDEWSAKIYGEVANSERKDVPVSCEAPLIEGVSVTPDGMLGEDGRPVMDLAQCPALQGAHNWQNAAFAWAACRAAGVPAAKIMSGLRSFAGLAHRQKIVAVMNGIRYINDSKATNDQAAAMALRTFDPIYWIAGGQPKDGGYGDCEKHLAHVRRAFLIGQAQDAMAAWLEKHNIAHEKCGTLETAVQKAHETAQRERLENAVVLLSPACASFDQYKNFEQRGEAFCALVEKIASQDAGKQTGTGGQA